MTTCLQRLWAFQLMPAYLDARELCWSRKSLSLGCPNPAQPHPSSQLDSSHLELQGYEWQRKPLCPMAPPPQNQPGPAVHGGLLRQWGNIPQVLGSGCGQQAAELAPSAVPIFPDSIKEGLAVAVTAARVTRASTQKVGESGGYTVHRTAGPAVPTQAILNHP